MNEKIKELSKKIKKQIAVLYQVQKHPKTPIFAKIIVVIALGYALSPIDLIPDFIPILGYLDDLIIVPFLIFIAVKLIPSEIWNDCAIKAENEALKPHKCWLAGFLMVLFWLIIAILIARNM